MSTLGVQKRLSSGAAAAGILRRHANGPCRTDGPKMTSRGVAEPAGTDRSSTFALERSPMGSGFLIKPPTVPTPNSLIRWCEHLTCQVMTRRLMSDDLALGGARSARHRWLRAASNVQRPWCLAPVARTALRPP